MEVYNEEINDLLHVSDEADGHGGKNLRIIQVRWFLWWACVPASIFVCATLSQNPTDVSIQDDPVKGPIIGGLIEEAVESEDEVVHS